MRHRLDLPLCSHPGSLRRFGLCTGACALLAFAPSQDAIALVVSCDDGSVIIAKDWEDVRCAGAVLVPRGSVPQLGSAPSNWQKSLLEAARERDLDEQIAAAVGRKPAVSAAPAASERQRFRFTAAERSDLALFIEHRQAAAPATVERDVSGLPARMRFAYSQVVEARVRGALAASGSPVPGFVLVFSLEPASAAREVGPPSFAQRGVTLPPDPRDPGQFGWIPRDGPDGGRMAPRLGYVGLPADFDPARHLVLFWADAVAVARLRPQR